MSHLGIAILPATASSAAKQPVPWSSVRSAVAETICVVPEARLPRGYYVSVGDRAACGLASAATPLERALDAGFREAAPLLVSVPPAFDVLPVGIEKAYQPTDPAERNRSAREMILAREELLRPLVPRLARAMAVEGLSCTDCPTFTEYDASRGTGVSSLRSHRVV